MTKTARAASGPDPLQDWEQWQYFARKPRLLCRLVPEYDQRHDKEYGNRSYLIESEGQRLVLRRNHVHSTRLGIDRQREAYILAAASKAGIAAPLLCARPEQGLLISDYIAGQHWQAQELNKARQGKLLELLEQTHALRIRLAPFDYAAHLDGYWAKLQDMAVAVPDRLSAQHEAVRAWLARHSAQRTLCHHDPHPHNIIEAHDRLYLLDWEYAGYGWPGMDYAALSLEWQLTLGQDSLPTQEIAQQLQQSGVFYRHLCHLWALLSTAKQDT